MKSFPPPGDWQVHPHWLCVRWRWKAFEVFFFFFFFRKWCHDRKRCDWVGDSKLDCRPCTVFFVVRITINKSVFFDAEVSTTSPTRQALFDDFFRDILKVDKNSTTLCGKKTCSFNLSVEQGRHREAQIWSKWIHSFFTSLSTGESGNSLREVAVEWSGLRWQKYLWVLSTVDQEFGVFFGS